MCLSVHLSIYLYLYLYFSIFLYIYLSIYMYIYIYVSIYLLIFLSQWSTSFQFSLATEGRFTVPSAVNFPLSITLFIFFFLFNSGRPHVAFPLVTIPLFQTAICNPPCVLRVHTSPTHFSSPKNVCILFAIFSNGFITHFSILLTRV